MKALVALLLLTFTGSAFAEKYNCLDQSGNHFAELDVFDGNEIFWSEPWHSAESSGKYLGNEDAPFSEFLGYRSYRLVDFFTTESSAHIFVIENLTAEIVKVATYFDDDGHDVDIEKYTCEKRH